MIARIAIVAFESIEVLPIAVQAQTASGQRPPRPA